MNQLIPLIIAIILGGFATVLSLVLIGPQFSERSADIKAQQFATAGSSIESALRIFKTERATSGFDNDFETTMVDGANSDGLVDLGYLSMTPVSPISGGGYDLVVDNNEVFLVSDTAAIVPDEICKAVVELEEGPITGTFTKTVPGVGLSSDMLGKRMYCFEANPTEAFIVFRVE